MFPHPRTCFRGGGLGSSPGLRRGPGTVPEGVPRVVLRLLPALEDHCCSHTLVLRQHSPRALPLGSVGSRRPCMPWGSMWPEAPRYQPPLLCASGPGAADVTSPRSTSPAPATCPPHLPNSCSTSSLHPCGKRVLSPRKVQAGHRGLSPTAQMWGLSLTAQGPQARTWWLDRQVTAQVNWLREKGKQAGVLGVCKGEQAVLTVAGAGGTAEPAGGIPLISPSAAPPPGPRTAALWDLGTYGGGRQLGPGPAHRGLSLRLTSEWAEPSCRRL